jgi:hypothetical protein
MLRPLALTLLVACGVESDPSNPFEGDSASPLATSQAGPPGLTLEGPAWLVPGYPATFEVTGPLASGEAVFFALGLGGVGPGPCPVGLGSQCLDIRPTIRLLGSSAESGGVATFTVTVPATAPTGRTVGMQSAAVRGAGGATSLLSNSIALPVRAAVFGCIDAASIDYDPAATVDDGTCTYTATQACTIREAEHPTYTTVDQRVALCGNTYDSSNMATACAPGWQVCTESQWTARFPRGVAPGGTLSTFGVPQADRLVSTWYAGAPAYTPESSWLWTCGPECDDGYNPWNNGKYLMNDSRTGIMKGNGSCCNWDAGFAPTSETSNFAVYCCAN